MLNRYFYLLIIFNYLSGCDEQPYEPYLVNAYNQAKLSQTIERFSSGASIPELSNEWKEALRFINETGANPEELDLKLEDNIKQLTIENRDTLWRVISSIAPAQQSLFLKALNSFNNEQQAALLDTILRLAHADEKLIKAVLSGQLDSLSVVEQIDLSNMVQDLKASDQTLLFQFVAKLGYNT